MILVLTFLAGLILGAAIGAVVGMGLALDGEREDRKGERPTA